MTSLVLAYDGSRPSAEAISAAAALFPGSDALVLTVRPEPITLQTAAAARVAAPDAVIAGAVEALERAAVDDAERVATEGASAAAAGGLAARSRVVAGASNPWREIADTAAAVGADVVVCGARGLNGVARAALGSTSTGLLHHARRPVLIVPAFEGRGEGPLVIGFDGSPAAHDAVTLTGRLVPGRSASVVTVWESALRHSPSGRLLRALPNDDIRAFSRDLDAYYEAVAADVAADGAALASRSGLRAEPGTVEHQGSPWRGLLEEARRRSASAVVVGARGRSSVSAALLGSVSSGLAHNATLPVLVAGGGAGNSGSASAQATDDGSRRRA